MISHCPTCERELAKDDFMSFAFILAGDICRHCLDDDPSGSKKQSMTIWLCFASWKRNPAAKRGCEGKTRITPLLDLLQPISRQVGSMLGFHRSWFHPNDLLCSP